MVNTKTIAAVVLLLVALSFGAWTLWNSNNQVEDLEFLVLGMILYATIAMIL